jgi:hypothetical protein
LRAHQSASLRKKSTRRQVWRAADAIDHQAADKIRDVMKPADELGTRIGGTKVKPLVDWK